MIGVSKTFGGSSILSSPARRSPQSLDFTGFAGFLFLPFLGVSPIVSPLSPSADDSVEFGDLFFCRLTVSVVIFMGR